MKNRIILSVALVGMIAALALTAAEAQRRGGTPRVYPDGENERMTELGRRNVRVHDPSTIVKCDDEYWLFYTGSGVPSYHSKDLLTWEAGPRVIGSNPSWLAQVVPPGAGRRGGRGPATGPTTGPTSALGAPASGSTTGPSTAPAFGRGRGRGFGGGVAGFWAPDVIHVGDQYLVFFSYSAFGRNTSAIAVASNPTLNPNDPNYKWTERGIVIQSRPSDDFNCIDPAATLDADGKLWVAFGSFWSGIKLIQCDPKTGLRISPDSPIYPIAHYSSIEASDIYFHDGYYYLFVDWGLCCRGADSTYDMRIGRSRTITGPYLDKDGKDMLQGGGSELLGSDGAFVGPGHAGVLKDGDKYWLSMHFYDGTTPPSGGTLAIRALTWDSDGWPVVGKKQ